MEKILSQIEERDLVPPFKYEILRSRGNNPVMRIVNKFGDVLITSQSEAMAKLIVHALNQTYPEKESEPCSASSTETT